MVGNAKQITEILKDKKQERKETVLHSISKQIILFRIVLLEKLIFP